MKVAGGILAGLLLVMLLSGCGGSGSGGGDSVAPSSDATLASLDPWPGVLDQVFQPGQLVYTATVGFLASSMTVTPVTTDAAARVSVNGQAVSSGTATLPIPLAIGQNLISIDVTAEDGVSTTGYTLSVTRQTGNEFARQAYIKASNSGSVDQFGYSLAQSGDTLAVGAYREDSGATGIDGDQGDNSLSDSGAVYIFTLAGTQWSQQAYIKASNTGAGDRFGISLALSGDTLAVGAYREDSSSTGIDGDQGDNSLSDSGAVYVYTRNGTQWSQQAYIKASNTGNQDNFGYSVALAGDTLAVGATGESSMATGTGGDQGDNSKANAGAVYVFTRDGAAWSQQAYIKASNTDAGDSFGTSIALSGDTLAVGANGEASGTTGINGDQDDNSQPNAGAVYVFARDGSAWSQQAYIKASNTGQTDPLTGENDAFGWSIVLSGETLAVGAVFEDSGASTINGDQTDNSQEKAGAVYVFTRDAATWSQQAYIKPSNTGSGDEFGWSLALSGDNLAVGALYEDSSSTGIGGDETNDGLSNSGAVYLFSRSGTDWSQFAYIKAASTDNGDFFGYSVALDGDVLSAGAIGEDSNATGIDGDATDNSLSGSGATYTFR
jgi:hypothetical protein